jgi:succinoglycan biosynthesis protein ExoA
MKEVTSLEHTCEFSRALPAVSVIVPCRNEKDHIENALRSILAQEEPEGGLEVLVADGMSDDGTRDILKRLLIEDHRLRMIDNRELIIPAALNAAIRQAQGKVIIRMDAHTEFAPDYVRQCLAVLHETAADNVGGPWIAKGRGLIARAIAAGFQSVFAVGGALCHKPCYEGPLDTVYLGCWPREAFDRYGLFDEELIRSEDDEFNLRLTRNGGKIWQSPRINSWYHPRESLLRLYQQQLQYGYWKVRVIQKHKIPASVRHLVPAGFVFAFVALAFASAWWSMAAWGWLLLVGTYLTCNLVASGMTAMRVDWKLFPFLPLVFACYHFAYGYGFLRGICDFIIFRRGPSRAYTELTRSSTKGAS